MSITEFFEGDHREIDAVFQRALEAARAGRAREALERFDAFDRALDRHIDWEETLLFPEFERATGMGLAGPTVVMREEHRRIRSSKRAIREALASLEGPAGPKHPVWGRVDDLVRVLEAHNAKEQEILYPQCDRRIDPEARGRILDAVVEAKSSRS